MTIYPDSSFLVSYLYPGDLHHRRARQFLRAHGGDTWLTSAWSQFETINALRSLCLASGGPSPATVEAIRRLFGHWHRRGPFDLERVDWDEVLKDANQISAAFASRQRARTADTLHVAILEQLEPDIFVSGDRDQAALARSRGFQTQIF